MFYFDLYIVNVYVILPPDLGPFAVNKYIHKISIVVLRVNDVCARRLEAYEYSLFQLPPVFCVVTRLLAGLCRREFGHLNISRRLLEKERGCELLQGYSPGSQ
jgi:hypothetical protein